MSKEEEWLPEAGGKRGNGDCCLIGREQRVEDLQEEEVLELCCSAM